MSRSSRSRHRPGPAGGSPGGTGALRTFVAVFPPPDVRQALEALRGRLEPELPGLRWTAAGNLHFTLRFFGDLAPEEADRAGEVVAATAADVVPFDLELAGVGVFPNWKRPRVLWAGCGRGRAVIEALARTLDRGFDAEGLGRSDKPFAAHLTLGRWRDGRGVDGERARAAAEPVGEVASFRVEEVVVVKSTLTPRGSVYEPLRTARLSGPPPRSGGVS